jgi:hypothetical protein
MSIAIARATVSIAIAAMAIVAISIAVAIVIAIVTVVMAVVAAVVSVIRAVIVSAVPSIPGASADEESAYEPAWSVIAVRGASIGGVRVISPAAYWRIIAVYIAAIHYCGRYRNADANAYRYLRMSKSKWKCDYAE